MHITTKQERKTTTHLEEHGTYKGHLLVNGRAAEHITGTKGQRDVLDQVSKELEVIHQTHEVKRRVYGAKIHKNILRREKRKQFNKYKELNFLNLLNIIINHYD